MKSVSLVMVSIMSLLLGMGCRSAPSASAAHEREAPPVVSPQMASGALKDPYINDAVVQRVLEQELLKWILPGKGTPGKTLREQATKNRKCRASLPSLSGETVPGEGLYDRICQSVVVLGTMSPCPHNCPIKWHRSSGATAFIVSADGLAVTNFHVVDIKEDNYFLGGITRTGRPFMVKEVLAADADADIALVRLEGDGGANQFTPLPIRSGAPTGTEIVVVGHPRMAHYTMTRGIISRRCRIPRGRVPEELSPVPAPVAPQAAPAAKPAPASNPALMADNNKKKERAAPPPAPTAGNRPMPKFVETLMIDADYAKGSSGAPICDLHGNVVGLVSSTSGIYYNEKADAARAGDLQMVFKQSVPIEKLFELIEKH